MANYSFSRLERCYLQVQPTFGTIPNSGGTASVAAADACRFIRLSMSNNTDLLARPDKTGTRSAQGMIRGRTVGQWSIEMSLASATAGVDPDCHPILQSLFGTTAAVGSGTAAVSSSTDASPIVLTTAAHGVPTGTLEVVTVAGHLVNTNANGTWLAYAGSTTTLTLIGSTGTGGGAGGATGSISRVKQTYSFVDDPTSYFTLWSFRQASSLDQRVAHTCAVTEATFNLGQDVATWTASGDCVWVLGSTNFSNADVYQKAGLGAFPTEPVSPVTSGGIVPGFTGRFVIGAAGLAASSYATSALAYPTVRTVTLRIQTATAMVRDTFGTYYPTMSEGGERNITATFSMYDDDSANLAALKNAADQKIPQDIYMQVGTSSGNTWVWILKNVYFASNALDDGQLRFAVNFGDSRATSSSLAVKDELTMVIA